MPTMRLHGPLPLQQTPLAQHHSHILPYLHAFPAVFHLHHDSNSFFRGLAFSMLTQLLVQIRSKIYPELRQRLLNIIMSHSLFYIDLPKIDPELDRILEEGNLMEEFIKLLTELETKTVPKRTTIEIQTLIIEHFNDEKSWLDMLSITLFRSLALTAAGKCGKDRQLLLELNNHNNHVKEQTLLILADYLQVKTTIITKDNQYRVDGSFLEAHFVVMDSQIYLLWDHLIDNKPQPQPKSSIYQSTKRDPFRESITQTNQHFPQRLEQPQKTIKNTSMQTEFHSYYSPTSHIHKTSFSGSIPYLSMVNKQPFINKYLRPTFSRPSMDLHPGYYRTSNSRPRMSSLNKQFSHFINPNSSNRQLSPRAFNSSRTVTTTTRGLLNSPTSTKKGPPRRYLYTQNRESPVKSFFGPGYYQIETRCLKQARRENQQRHQY